MKGRRADIHFHLLPGVDDGAANLEESVELARLAEADGTGVIVATPHVSAQYVTDVSDLPDRVAEVRARLRLEGVDVDVRCGGELRHDMVGRLGQSDLDTIAGGYGAEAERHALWLVGAGVVTCLASDAHPGWRGPGLGVGLEKASWALTRARARILTDSAPRALLEHGTPIVAPAA
jgi:tyrosine-protein phosphatase YwqE